MSYNTTALICKRLAQDGRAAGNCNGKHGFKCWSLTLTRSEVECKHLPLSWNRSADPTLLECENYIIVCNCRSRTDEPRYERILLFLKVYLGVRPRVTKVILDILCVSSKPVMVLKFPSAMPQHCNHPLVVGCGTGHKPHPLSLLQDLRHNWTYWSVSVNLLLKEW